MINGISTTYFKQGLTCTEFHAVALSCRFHTMRHTQSVLHTQDSHSPVVKQGTVMDVLLRVAHAGRKDSTQELCKCKMYKTLGHLSTQQKPTLCALATGI